jgi:hypothetical protein
MRRPLATLSARHEPSAGHLIFLNSVASTEFRWIGISYSSEVRESLMYKMPLDVLGASSAIMTIVGSPMMNKNEVVRLCVRKDQTNF